MRGEVGLGLEIADLALPRPSGLQSWRIGYHREEQPSRQDLRVPKRYTTQGFNRESSFWYFLAEVACIHTYSFETSLDGRRLRWRASPKADRGGLAVRRCIRSPVNAVGRHECVRITDKWKLSHIWFPRVKFYLHY